MIVKLKKVLKEFNVKHVRGRPYNPKCQGLSENINRHVKKYLQLAYLTNHTVAFDIKTVLHSITLGYNKRVHSVTKIEPEKAFFTPTMKIKQKLEKEQRNTTTKILIIA